MSLIKLQGNASGTGAFTIAAPNGNTDRTLTLPDNTGTVLTSASTSVLPKGGPAFWAKTSADQSVGPSVATKLAPDTEDFDTASCYNNTGSTVGGIPSYSFLPNVAGYYQVNGNFQYNGASFTGVFSLQLYKNNTLQQELAVVTYLATYTRANGSTLVYLNGITDYIHLSGYHVQASSQPTSTIFSASLVRAD